ncbi:hypothetical protein JCM11491_002547 [Sporobolomyces phaffii]
MSRQTASPPRESAEELQREIRECRQELTRCIGRVEQRRGLVARIEQQVSANPAWQAGTLAVEQERSRARRLLAAAYGGVTKATMALNAAEERLHGMGPGSVAAPPVTPSPFHAQARPTHPPPRSLPTAVAPYAHHSRGPDPSASVRLEHSSNAGRGGGVRAQSGPAETELDNKVKFWEHEVALHEAEERQAMAYIGRTNPAVPNLFADTVSHARRELVAAERDLSVYREHYQLTMTALLHSGTPGPVPTRFS